MVGPYGVAEVAAVVVPQSIRSRVRRAVSYSKVIGLLRQPTREVKPEPDSWRVAASPPTSSRLLTHRWRWKDYRPFLDLEPDSRVLYRLGRE